MREIKFRAWNGEKMYPNIHEWGEGEFWRKIKGETFDDLLQSDWQVMQFTGLKDKNDREIYENDVVRVTETFSPFPFVPDKPYTITVGFFMGCFVGTRTEPPIGHENDKLIFTSDAIYEVIGNIHENPGLLKG